MFMTAKKIQKVVEETIKQVLGSEDEVPKLKRELAELRLQKEIEQRDIDHLIKIKHEKLNIEYQQKELGLKDQYKDKEMALQKEYHGKVMANIEVARAEMKDIYSKIMERLPNISMEITKKVK